jgi:ubiquinone/menaquinone biosynthesis C-methylase UbiE
VAGSREDMTTRFRDAESLRAARENVAAQYGPWTTPVDLGFGVRSIEAEDPSRGTRLSRLVRIVRDLAGRPLEGVSILDLACLEGMVSVALAREGARVLGIEARAGNVARARFAKEALGLEGFEVVQDDVRNLSREKYGSFEIVLCLGILYHLPAPDVFAFAERVAEVTGRSAVIDTHFAQPASERPLLGPPVSVSHRGAAYEGRSYREFEPDSAEKDRLQHAWSSLDARPSFWPTRDSLLALLAAAGFTSLHESLLPRWIGMPEDRVTLVAFKGAMPPAGG